MVGGAMKHQPVISAHLLFTGSVTFSIRIFAIFPFIYLTPVCSEFTAKKKDCGGL